MTEVLGKRPQKDALKSKANKKVKSKIETGEEVEDAENISKSIKKKSKELPPQNEEITEEQKEENEKGTKGRAKKVHLEPEQIQERIKELQQKVDELAGPENFNKRKRVYQRLIQLKKALGNPELIVDPNEEKKRIEEDKQRRIQKKLDKAKEQKKQTLSHKKKNSYCIICRTRGHLAEGCREGKSNPKMVQELGRHICFNCGRDDHALKDCPEQRGEYLSFATCFFCKEKGHLSRDCPKNEEGIYHKGGSCFECGSKRHLAKECPVRHNRLHGGGFTDNNVQNNENNDEGQEGENYGEDEENENDIFSENEDDA